jgi:hypothetical protein
LGAFFFRTYNKRTTAPKGWKGRAGRRIEKKEGRRVKTKKAGRRRAGRQAGGKEGRWIGKKEVGKYGGMGARWMTSAEILRGKYEFKRRKLDGDIYKKKKVHIYIYIYIYKKKDNRSNTHRFFFKFRTLQDNIASKEEEKSRKKQNKKTGRLR